MNKFLDVSVRRKLIAILTITTSAALLLVAMAFIVYDHHISQRDAIDHLVTLGQIVADNSSAAVVFNDANSASEVLATLHVEPEIQEACTYDRSLHLLAEYHRGTGQLCPKLKTAAPGAFLNGVGATYSQPIMLHERATGYTFLQSNLAQMKLRQSRFTTITAIFLFVSLAIATSLGTVLQRWITSPLLELVGVMQNVSKSTDYSLRAEPRGADEIGQLVEGFNLMLTEIESSHQQLQYKAFNDELTGLPNRRLFADRLRIALEQAKRRRGIVALIYLDLDGFKLVNDTLGHATGDQVLCQVAERLRGRVRVSDTLARLGGDEFAVVAVDLRSTEDATTLADDLLCQFAESFHVEGHDFSLTVSLGISYFPKDSEEADNLVCQADTAMYVAKTTGKNKVVIFTGEFGEAVKERLELENRLRGAISRGEMFVHYQPQFEASTHRLVSFEALARWIHPTFGVIPPTKFIPIAEETGLIVPIGMWIMEQACQEAAKWQSLTGSPVQVAVNISTIQLMQKDFAIKVADVLERTDLDPRLLQCELTESVLLPEFCEAQTSLAQLRELGVSLALDDFGTGYSSLSYLQRAFFHSVKLDRSFLAQMALTESGQATMQSIVSLSHTLDMRVTVEGVETLDQLSLAEELGCDQMQGNLLGRPTPNTKLYIEKEYRRALGGGVTIDSPVRGRRLVGSQLVHARTRWQEQTD